MTHRTSVGLENTPGKLHCGSRVGENLVIDDGDPLIDECPFLFCGSKEGGVGSKGRD